MEDFKDQLLRKCEVDKIMPRIKKDPLANCIDITIEFL